MSEEIILDQINHILRGSKRDKGLNELFEQKREKLGLSIKQVSNVLAIDYGTLNKIVKKETNRIDYLNVLKLSQFLGIDRTEFGHLFYDDVTEAVKELDSVRRYTFLVNNFDLKSLKKAGFIESIADLDAISERINEYFGFESIFEYNEELAGALFSSTQLSESERMKRFWVKSAYAMFKKIDNPNKYNRDLLKDLIPKIRPYTRHVEDGLATVAQALFNAGVTIIFQPYLTKTAVRGATFCVDGKPGIVITDYNKYYPTIWFALIHELYHVLYDLDDIKKNTSFHLTGDEEPDMFLLQEDKANEFAREYLFSKDKSKYIRPMINNHQVVSEYAEKNQIHPSIIYAFYQWDQDSKGHNFWGAFRKYFPDVEKAVEKLKLVPWEKDTIDESVQELKQTVSKFS